MAEQIVSLSPEEIAALDHRRQQDKQRARTQLQRSRREVEAMLGWDRVTSAADWAQVKAQVAADWESGVHLLTMLGGERYLAPERSALLLHLWRQYVAYYRPQSPAEYQAIAMTLISWFHFERLNEFIGNLELRLENDIFTQAPLEVNVYRRKGPPASTTSRTPRPTPCSFCASWANGRCPSSTACSG